jgi:hypothetical protein
MAKRGMERGKWGFTPVHCQPKRSERHIDFVDGRGGFINYGLWSMPTTLQA